MKKLPNKWCIKPDTEEQGLVVRNYINELMGEEYYSASYTCKYYWHYSAYSEQRGSYCWTSPSDKTYKVITFDQFEKWVLKKYENCNYLIEVLKRHNVI